MFFLGFFTENCMVLCEGHSEESIFHVEHMAHPPLYSDKAVRFQLKTNDYFGAYTKKRREMLSSTGGKHLL